jgi:hypothetical protein
MKDNNKHESFGLISFSRVTGSNDFFGSNISFDSYIQLRISGAFVETSLGRDNYYKDKLLLQVRMTNSQFAELITSLNTGSGTPCTLEYSDGKKFESLPKQKIIEETAKKEFSLQNDEFLEQVRRMSIEANEIIEKKTLTKEDRKKLNWFFGNVFQQVSSNIPFYEKQFEERIDSMIADAKVEIENEIIHRLTNVGFQQINNSKMLGE